MIRKGLIYHKTKQPNIKKGHFILIMSHQRILSIILVKNSKFGLWPMEMQRARVKKIYIYIYIYYSIRADGMTR